MKATVLNDSMCLPKMQQNGMNLGENNIIVNLVSKCK